MKVICVPKEPDRVSQMLAQGYSPNAIHASCLSDLEEIIREYAVMAELKGNANIVYCDDIYKEPAADGIGWVLYIRMELCTPLMKALHIAASPNEIIRLGMDLSSALMACQKKNILHRDIKPGNVMMAADGNFKLGDFGVARKLEEQNSQLTRTGTYSFMAPEVYNSQNYDARADIYSVGMVLYWLLNRYCGPFLPLPPNIPTAAEQEQASQYRFSGTPLPAPATGSAALQQVVLKACAFDPKDRFQTPSELHRALQALYTEPEVEEPPVRPPVIQNPGQDPRTKGPFHDLPPMPPVLHDPNEWDPVGGGTVYEPQPIPIHQDPTVRPEPIGAPPRQYSRVLAMLLAIFPYTGLFGVHDFYLGNKGRGLLKLCTINFLAIGWFVDIITLLLGIYKDGNGNPVK